MDTVTGKINGFIHIEVNLSAFLSTFKNEKLNTDNGSTDNTKITVMHDRLNFPLSIFIQKELMNAFQKFTKSILSNCSLSEKLGNMM